MYASRKRKYSDAKWYAKKRGIPWLFNYVTWWRKWCESSKWHLRGNKRDQYVMSRPEDKGPYAPWNVRICLSGENIREAHLGKKRSTKSCQRISKSKIGNKNWIHQRRDANGQFTGCS